MLRKGRRIRRVTSKDLKAVGKALFKEPKCDLHRCPVCGSTFDICTPEKALRYDQHLQSHLIAKK